MIKTAKRIQLTIIVLSILAFISLIIWVNNSNAQSGNTIFEEEETPRRYVLFDLGANNGDDILAFFHLQARFPQFVGNLNCLQFGSKAEHAKWLIYAFEANERFDKDLDYTVELMKNLEPQHDVKVFKHTAAWTYDGTVDFYIDTTNPFGFGSSLISKHPDVVKSKANATKVACRDIATMLKQFDKNDFVVVKMDIEGAEYELILDLIRKDVVQLIDHLALEYHRYLSLKPEAILSTILKFYGITFSSWI